MTHELNETELGQVTYALRELAGRRAEQSIDWRATSPKSAQGAGESSKELYALSERLQNEAALGRSVVAKLAL